MVIKVNKKRETCIRRDIRLSNFLIVWEKFKIATPKVFRERMNDWSLLQ
jgi:hypothetical protein